MKKVDSLVFDECMQTVVRKGFAIAILLASLGSDAFVRARVRVVSTQGKGIPDALLRLQRARGSRLNGRAVSLTWIALAVCVLFYAPVPVAAATSLLVGGGWGAPEKPYAVLETDTVPVHKKVSLTINGRVGFGAATLAPGIGFRPQARADYIGAFDGPTVRGLVVHTWGKPSTFAPHKTLLGAEFEYRFSGFTGALGFLHQLGDAVEGKPKTGVNWRIGLVVPVWPN